MCSRGTTSIYRPLAGRGLAGCPATPCPCNGRPRSALLGPMAVPRTARKMKLRPQRHAPRTGRGLSEWTDLRATLSSSLRLLSALYTRRTICQAPFARAPRIFRKFPEPVQNTAAAKNGQNSLVPYHIYRFDTRPTVHPAASAAPPRSLSRQARRSFSGRQCPQGKRPPFAE